MSMIAWDIETLKACFCICAEDTDGKQFEYCVANDELVEPRKVAVFLDGIKKYGTHVTYNGKAFDIRVLAWVAAQKKPLTVQEIGDQASLLIADSNSKNNTKSSLCWKARCDDYRKNHFDVLKCYTQGHSLKWWELARGWSVKETDVAWDKPYVTPAEVESIKFYCHHDVHATLKLALEKDCLGRMEAREWLMDGCDSRPLPDLTIAELSETYTYGDIDPEKVKETGTVEELIDWYSYDIPTNVLDAFMAVGRGDAEGFFWNGNTGKIIFAGSEEYNALMKSSKGTFFDSGWASYGKGGAHYCKAGRNKRTRIYDVASLYPSIIEHWLHLKTEKAQKKYVDGKHERIRIKRLKGTPEYKKPVDLGLKLNLNSLSGKFRMKGAKAYAPNHGLAMCILGQLLITEATWYAMGKDPKNWYDVVEINTDSFAVLESNSEMVRRSQEYMKSIPHKFEFEEEVFPDSYWKDVNHYVVYKEDGSFDFDKGSEVINSEPILLRSLYNQANKDLDEPLLLESDDIQDWLVKYAKAANAKNASIDGKPMDKKYYYFLWVTNECKDRVPVMFNGNVQERKMGVWGFDPEDLKKYMPYLDREQYMEDYRHLLDVWGFKKLAAPPAKIKKINPFFDVAGGLF